MRTGVPVALPGPEALHMLEAYVGSARSDEANPSFINTSKRSNPSPIFTSRGFGWANTRAGTKC